jgi:hypothetical protein
LFKNDILTPLHPLELQGGFVTGRREWGSCLGVLEVTCHHFLIGLWESRKGKVSNLGYAPKRYSTTNPWHYEWLQVN